MILYHSGELRKQKKFSVEILLSRNLEIREKKSVSLDVKGFYQILYWIVSKAVFMVSMWVNHLEKGPLC